MDKNEFGAKVQLKAQIRQHLLDQAERAQVELHDAMFEAISAGMTYAEVGKLAGVSRIRVGQIVASYRDLALQAESETR